MTQGTEPFTRGQFVRFTENHGRHRKGEAFEVFSYFEGFQPGDAEYGNDDYIQGPIVEGASERGTVEVPASVVEPATDNEGRPLEPVPAASVVVEEVASALHNIQWNGAFDVVETSIDGSRVEV